MGRHTVCFVTRGLIVLLSGGGVIGGVRRTCGLVSANRCNFKAFVSNPSGATSVRRTLMVNTRKTQSIAMILVWVCYFLCVGEE